MKASCSEGCGRKALFQTKKRKRLRADKEHSMCRQCFESQRDSLNHKSLNKLEREKTMTNERELEVMPPDTPPNGDASLVRSESQQVGVVSEPNPLIVEAIRVSGLTFIERLQLIEKVEEVYWKRQQAKAEAEFYAALSAFQAECPVIDKTKPVFNKDGRTVRYFYAPLGEIVKQAGPCLTKHGLSYDFSAKVVPFSEEDGGPFLEIICHVHHSGGHTRDFPYKSLIENNDYMNPTQHAGSANTYAKRYAFCNALGILTADEDTDAADQPERTERRNGNGNGRAGEQIAAKTAQRQADLSEKLRTESKPAPVERTQLTPAQDNNRIEQSTIKLLTSKMKNAALSTSDFKNRFGLTSVDQIDKGDLNIVLKWIMDPQNA